MDWEGNDDLEALIALGSARSSRTVAEPAAGNHRLPVPLQDDETAEDFADRVALEALIAAGDPPALKRAPRTQDYRACAAGSTKMKQQKRRAEEETRQTKWSATELVQDPAGNFPMVTRTLGLPVTARTGQYSERAAGMNIALAMSAKQRGACTANAHAQVGAVAVVAETGLRIQKESILRFLGGPQDLDGGVEQAPSQPRRRVLSIADWSRYGGMRQCRSSSASRTTCCSRGWFRRVLQRRR